MSRYSFDTELHELHNELLRMGSLVEKQIYECVNAIIKQNTDIAEEVVKNDDEVDEMQKIIEDKCVILIARQQPLAKDLRNIFTTIKIATDLERMADHAVDIAKMTKRLKNQKYIKQLVDIPRMSDIVKVMIKDSLDAYVEGNVEKAYSTCKMDDEIDAIYKRIFDELLDIISTRPEAANQGAQFMFICKYLERIADHATNICESTIYLVTGEHIDLND